MPNKQTLHLWLCSAKLVTLWLCRWRRDKGNSSRTPGCGGSPRLMYNHQVPAYRYSNTKLISLRIGVTWYELTFSYHIANDTWPDEHYHIAVSALLDANCIIALWCHMERFNPLKPELNPICYLLALLAHHFLHVSRIRVKSLPIRLLMSYIYGAPILDVSRSHTTTQHSR